MRCRFLHIQQVLYDSKHNSNYTITYRTKIEVFQFSEKNSERTSSKTSSGSVYGSVTFRSLRGVNNRVEECRYIAMRSRDSFPIPLL